MMQEAKDTARSTVRIGYDGRVHKFFRAQDARQRFDNEVRVLRYLEHRGCNFVPRVLEADRDELRLVTTNCGARVEQISDEKMQSLFAELETYGVRHDDPYLRNITYRASDGRFCLIDFEFATILDDQAGVAGEFPDDATAGMNSAPPEPVSRVLRWSGTTDRGRTRPNNEDAFLTIAFDMRDLSYLGREGEANVGGLDFIFAVSDGMGGEKSGEFASRFTVDNIIQLLPRRYEISPAHYASEISDCLQYLFQKIHLQLTKLGQSYAEGQNMGATLSLIWYCGDRFYFGHVGDSRIYHLPKDGGLRQISDDHTYVGWLRRKGDINEREARMHPRRNVLAQALGSGNRYVDPQVGEIHCQSGDRLLLCTDGVMDGLWDRAIEEFVRHPPSAVADAAPAVRLVRAAVAESGRDNATAVVIEIN